MCGSITTSLGMRETETTPCNVPCMPRWVTSPNQPGQARTPDGTAVGQRQRVSVAYGWMARRSAASCTRPTQLTVVVVEYPAVPPHPAVLVTLPRSEPRRTRPAATSVTPSTAARPTENPQPPIRRRCRRTARRRLALPGRLQGDSDRATPPTRARRLGGLPPDSLCSAPEPVNFETRPRTWKSTIQPRPDRPASLSERSNRNSRSSRKSATSSVMDWTACARNVNHKSETRKAACATRVTTEANSSPLRHRA